MALASQRTYPFTAVVGSEKVKTALLLNVINPDIGGVLIRGEKGSGKSLLVHALKELLPEIDVFEGCRFNCGPHQEYRCIDCMDRIEKGETLRVRSRKMDMVEVPLNITEDRLLGSIDLEGVLTKGVATFEPGILAAAHRNILYVDEMNLLDDTIVDALLDAAAMNIVSVEREGISISYPTRFVLIGSMNPEEGELRPQLLDRLALLGETETVGDLAMRSRMLEDTILFEKDYVKFREKYAEQQKKISGMLRVSREIIPRVKISPQMLSLIAWIGIQFNVDGHRADIIMERTAKAHAALMGRNVVGVDDVIIAAELALPHRMRKKPFEEMEFSESALRSLVEDYVKKMQ